MTRIEDLPTPCLILDAEAMEANIATAFGIAKAAGIALRPHAKSHKCVEIARTLAEAGATGACVATLAEAEALAGAGIGGLLLTAPVASAEQLTRVARMRAEGVDLRIVADHPSVIAPLGAALREAGATLEVLVDCDPGLGRTGVPDAAAAVALAQEIAATEGLSFGGVQFYYGQLQHREDFADRRAAVLAEAERLRGIVAALTDAGLPPAIVTGGGTGTLAIDTTLDLFTELQPGSFLFMDSHYGRLPMLADGTNPFRQSLWLLAAVVSVGPGRATVSAGLKAFATDSGLPIPAAGAPEGAGFRFMGDEHGRLELPEGAAMTPGALVELVPSHCDPTVNLHAGYALRRGGRIVDHWAVVGRYPAGAGATA